MSEIFGSKLGQYILLEQLGEGGMAKVYNAFDTRVEKNVAIKVILPSKRSSRIFLQQFEMEARALASLTHTSIVKVLNYGIEEDQPFLVMEYVPGGTLKEALTKPLPWHAAAAILAPIARALEYVHQQQIVHRDIKPSNILLQEDFSPMLSDFGILKLLENKEENVNAAIGVGVGTPEYMSPEQGMGKEVDFRADIYSLGLVFYEMVTGQKPFTADTPMAVVLKHVTDEITLPTTIHSKIPKYVEQALLRAVQKDPAKRYPSMRHFADVLELIALGANAPRKRIVNLSKYRGRRRLSLLAVSLIGLLIAGSAYFGYQGMKNQGTPPSVTEPTSESAALDLTRAESTTPTTPVPQNTATNPSPTLLPEATPTLQLSADLSLLGMPLEDKSVPPFTEIARWGIGGINVVQWTVDGKSIALGTTSGIFIYPAEGREASLFIDTKFNVVAMAFSPDGQELTAGSPDGQARAWNAQSGQMVRDYAFARPVTDRPTGPGPVRAIAYSANGRNIAIGYESGALNFFVTDQETPVLVAEQSPSVEDILISSDNRFMYVTSGDNKIAVWDIAAKKKTHDLIHNSVVTTLRFSQDQGLLLSGGGSNSVYLWDVVAEKLIKSLSNPGRTVIDFDFSYDDKLVAIALDNGTIQVFETPAQGNASVAIPVRSIEGTLTGRIRSIAFSPDQMQVASANWEDGLKIWNARTGAEVFSLDQSMRAVDDLYFSKDGNWLATAHEDNKVRIWKVATATEYQLPGYLPRGIPFSPDNLYLTIIQPTERFEPDAIKVVELSTGKIIAELPGYQPDAFVQFTDDSKLLVTGNVSNASLWDVGTWEQLKTHGGPTAGCGQYFTPENHLLAVIADSGILFSYDQTIVNMCGTNILGATLMYYFQEPNQMVFVKGDGNIWLGNSDSDDISNQRFSTPYPLSDEIFLAGDQAEGWYAYTDSNKEAIFLRNLDGSLRTTIPSQQDYLYQVALSAAKKYVALGSRYGSIHILTMP